MKVTQMLPVYETNLGGKQWQRSIRGRRNWDVELGLCVVIRYLRSVAFVWETKRPQADNSWSLIDRQVSCFFKELFSLSITLSLKFVPGYAVDSKSALIKAMGWQ